MTQREEKEIVSPELINVALQNNFQQRSLNKFINEWIPDQIKKSEHIGKLHVFQDGSCMRTATATAAMVRLKNLVHQKVFLTSRAVSPLGQYKGGG